MNILVTGAGGMVGSHMVELLHSTGENVIGTFYKPTTDIKEISNDIKKDLNKLNEDFLDKYNLNDGLHSEESKIDDVFGKKTDNKNKIKLQGIDIDKSNNKNDKTTIQMYKYEDGEFKKINSNEIDSYIKQQSKEDKLETFADLINHVPDLINHVLGFKYC